MSLKQVTNIHQDIHRFDNRKLTSPEPVTLPQELTSHFHSIFRATLDSIENINYPYLGSSDPLFAARARQVEWIFSIQTLFDLADDTIFEAILIMDKYISLKAISIHNMNKLAVVCVIISSKTNQIYPLKMFRLNQASRFCYSNSQYVQLEMEVLSVMDFQLPHGSTYQLFKVYQTMFKLNNLIKNDSIMFVLRKCVLDYNLLGLGVQATSLAAISYLCHLNRISINFGVLIQTCREYSSAFLRINEMIQIGKCSKQVINPQNQEYIIV